VKASERTNQAAAEVNESHASTETPSSVTPLAFCLFARQLRACAQKGDAKQGKQSEEALEEALKDVIELARDQVAHANNENDKKVTQLLLRFPWFFSSVGLRFSDVFA